MKIKSIHFFRGIAILFIIAGHFLTNISLAKGINEENMSVLNKILTHFIYGGTGYFVFISGFLFYSVFYKRFQYGEFVKKKIQNVFIPYLILSIYPIVNMFFIDKNYMWYGAEKDLLSVLKILFLGNHMTGYWYISFIMMVFSLSPLHKKYIETNYKGIILIVFTILAFFVKRPWQNSNQFQALIFFTPFYLLGIYSAINREKILKILENKKIIMLLSVVLLEIINTVIIKNIEIYDKYILQKMICCLLIFVFLAKYEDKKWIVLDKLAEYSFAIYFLHSYVMRVFENQVIPRIKEYNFILIFCLEMFIVLIITMSVAFILKKILGKYSRYIIGY